MLRQGPSLQRDDSRECRTAIRVISLETATERRRAFAGRAERTTARWSFFDARTTPDPDLTWNRNSLLRHKGRELLPGERGNYSSHFALWRELAASDHDQLIVFEDDIWVDWPFVERLARTDLAAHGVGYLNLIVKRLAPFREVGHVGERALVQFMGYTHGTCYAVTRSRAAESLDYLGHVRGNFDNMLDRSWANGFPNLTVFPTPAFELGYKTGSAIGAGDRFAEKPPSTAWRIRRAVYRRWDPLRRAAYIAGQQTGLGPRARASIDI